MMSLFITFPTSHQFGPALHGGQPGLDDWLPVVAFALGLVVCVGGAVYNLKKQRQLLGYAGWSAYVSGTATIVTFVSAILFFSLGQPFGTLNDIASVFQLSFMLPLALILDRLFRPHSPTLSFLAAVLGMSGMLVGAGVQSLLVAGAITYQQTVPFLHFGSAIGGWLVLSSYLSLSTHLFPRGLAWAGLLAGVGYVMTVVGFLLGSYQSPVFYAGGLLMVSSYSTWAFWLGRVLLAGHPAAAHASGV